MNDTVYPMGCVYPWLPMSWGVAVKTAGLFWNNVLRDGTEQFLIGPIAGAEPTDITEKIVEAGEDFESFLSEESGYLMIRGHFPLLKDPVSFTASAEIVLYNQIPSIYVAINGSGLEDPAPGLAEAFDNFIFEKIYRAPYSDSNEHAKAVKFAKERREWRNKDGGTVLAPEPSDIKSGKKENKRSLLKNPFIVLLIVIGFFFIMLCIFQLLDS